jgi:hypothetical protein
MSKKCNVIGQTTKLLLIALFPNLLLAQQTIGFQARGNENIDRYVWSFSKNKAKANAKPLVDFSAMDNWPRIGEYLSVSDDGKYFAYAIDKPSHTKYGRRRLDSLVIEGIRNSCRIAVAGAEPVAFTSDNKQYVYKNGESLCFLQLGSTQLKIVKDVASLKVSANKWLAYQLKDKNGVILLNLTSGKEKTFSNVTDYNFDDNGEWLISQNKTTKKFYLYDLSTSKERQFDNVSEYLFSQNGKALLLRINVSSTSALQYISLPQANAKTIWTTKEGMDIGSYSIDNLGRQIAFTIVDSSGLGKTDVWYYDNAVGIAVPKIKASDSNIPAELTITNLSFTNNDRYIKLLLSRKPDAVIKPTDEIARLEVWNHKDRFLKSIPSEELNQTDSRSAILNIKLGKLVLLESSDKKIKIIQGDFAIVEKKYTEQYGDRFWERREDSVWLVSLKDNSIQLLPTKSDQFWFSPGGNYLVYFDVNKASHYFSCNLITGALKDITLNVPANHLGRFSIPDGSFQIPDRGDLGAWIENDAGVLVYDNYDIWKLDLAGKRPAVNMTNGYGQSNDIILNLFKTDPLSDKIPTLKTKEVLLLQGFNSSTKKSGFFRKNIFDTAAPEQLCMGDYFMTTMIYHDLNVISNSGMNPVKAKSSNSWIVQRQSSDDGPNYYETTDFKNFSRLTNFQPQKNYQWFTEKIHYYKQLDGKMGQGILYKPENFDSTKKYPVLIAFYGAFSNNMNQFPTPTYLDQGMAPGRSPLWFLNNGYLLFTPDIAVAPLKHGPKAFSVIEGAAKFLNSLPYVDGNKLGYCAHSWSAKLGAYLLTHSTSFSATAISEGFGYADMLNMAFSGKDGGNSLEQAESGFQYGELWKNKEVWLDQTTIFNVDNAKIPLLLLCNKESLPEYQDQTLQLFTALRRLEKNVWWLKYDEGEHALYVLRDRKDYTIRYTQFFDHYLKYAPAPRWMTQEIPVKLKGIETRYELDPQGKCNSINGEHCPICEAWNKQYEKTPAMFQKDIKDWELDSDIAHELQQKINEKRKQLDKQGEFQKNEVLKKLKDK